MNADIEITMTYKGLGANPDGTVTEFCEADLEKVKLVSEIIKKGQRRDTISGQITVKKEYEDFALYLNDEDGYFVDSDYFTYRLWYNGEELNVNKIKLIEINKEEKELIFTLYDNCVNEYSKISTAWESEVNIRDYVPDDPTNPVKYDDFRTKNTKQTVETGVQTGIDINAYIQEKLNEDDEWLPIKFHFLVVPGSPAPTYTITTDWVQFEAYGYNDGDSKSSPAGENWIYQSTIGTIGTYFKKPKWSLIGQAYVDGSGVAVDIIYEDLSNIEYTRVKISPQLIIRTLLEVADSTIAFDSDSFVGIDDAVGYGTFNGSTRFLADLQMIPISDFIPSSDGSQNDVYSTVAYISLYRIMSWFEQYGFYWYLEVIADVPYFRIVHPTTRDSVEGTTNPDINEETYKTERYKIKDAEYDVIVNSSRSGTHEFKFSQFIYRIRENKKTKPFEDFDIYSDIDLIIDAKGREYDILGGKQWAMISTTRDTTAYPYPYECRSFLSAYTSITINNFELSFQYLCNNFMPVPGKRNEDGTIYDDDRVEYRKEIKFNMPLNENPQTYFNFYNTIEYFGKQARIDKVERELLGTEAQITLNLL